MKTILKLILQIFNLLLYYASYCIRKDKSLWVFGSWFGDKYCDSPKYLFEYISNCHSEIRCVWLSNNQSTIDLVRNLGFEAYYTYSLKGYSLSSRAMVSVVSTSFEDVNKYIPTKYIINTWHGIPLKKVLYDDKINNSHKDTYKSFILRTIFPFRKIPSDYSIIIASSESEAINLSSAFNRPITNISICGLPRNDVFKKCGQPSNNKKIIYMPTHRGEGKFDIYNLFESELLFINSELLRLGIDLYVKLHFYHSNADKKCELSNIHFIRDDEINQDIYSIINSFDILITDYSSVYFDFLLSERPIIFAPFDLDDYLSLDREMYFDYNEVTPGPKCKNWHEVMEWIDKFNNNPDHFVLDRKLLKDLFHAYQDGRSCERVYKEALRLIGNCNN